MNKIKKGLKIGFLTFGMMMIFGCGTVDEEVVVSDKQGEELVENEKSCNVDSDCVPASCCHSTDVVNQENAPSCENLKCTASCETVLDCGQGKPVCKEGLCEIEVSGESDLRGEKSRDLEKITEMSVDTNNEKPSKENCDKFFNTEKLTWIDHQNFQGLDLIRKQFNNEEIKDGWCLYKKVGDRYQTIGSGNVVGAGSVNFLTLTSNGYLIYEERCGVPCAKISALNIYDFNDNMKLNDSFAWEISQDNEWFIDYSYGLYGGIHNDYLIRATNLNTFETIDFAENHCNDRRKCDFNVSAGRMNTFIDKEKNILKIPFVDKKTGEKNYRTFDMKNNFKEI